MASEGEASVLDAAESALDRGDFGTARRLLQQAGQGDDKRRQALRWRLRPDWVVGVQLAGTVVLLATVLYLTLGR